jgi:hypothetical protein
VVIHEAAHAKDLATRSQKGTYAASRMLPLVPLYQESIATGDTLGYDRDQEATADEREAYKVLYPAYGTYIAGEGLELASYFGAVSYPAQLAFKAAVIIPSHIIGRVKAANVEERKSSPVRERPEELPASDPQPVPTGEEETPASTPPP